MCMADNPARRTPQNPGDIIVLKLIGVAAAAKIGLDATATAADLRSEPAERWIDEAQGAFEGGAQR